MVILVVLKECSTSVQEWEVERDEEIGSCGFGEEERLPWNHKWFGGKVISDSKTEKDFLDAFVKG